MEGFRFVIYGVRSIFAKETASQIVRERTGPGWLSVRMTGYIFLTAAFTILIPLAFKVIPYPYDAQWGAMGLERIGEDLAQFDRSLKPSTLFLPTGVILVLISHYGLLVQHRRYPLTRRSLAWSGLSVAVAHVALWLWLGVSVNLFFMAVAL